MHASVTVGSLVLDVPLVNGSGVVDAVGAGEEWNLPAARLSKLGAFTTKTITRAARPGNPQPWAEVIAPGTLANAAGLPNPGIGAAMVDWAHLPTLLGIPVIASIGGIPEDLPDLAVAVQSAGWASAIELNLSCPNVTGGLVAADRVAVEAVLTRVRARVSLPLLAKLTPACGDIGGVARAAVSAGADALTCANTIPVRAVGPAGAPLLGAGAHGGMSGAGLHPIALRLVAEAAAAVDVPIIGLGGVDGIAAADRMLDAGASIIGVGTGAVFDPTLIDTLAAHLRPGSASTTG
jgi:dihydroorotate dehydrogenase (NAD+) catalytic subunit